MNVLLSVLKRESRRGREGGKKGEGKKTYVTAFPVVAEKGGVQALAAQKTHGKGISGFFHGTYQTLISMRQQE
ncbi:MAG TPA: hypothetical protein PK445_10850 [Methanolinea sp.]|nr:hypothetical protein [Methanolinea sp.]